MKLLATITMILGLGLAALAANAEGGKDFTVNVKGMTCASCVKSVEEKVGKALSGVKGVEINISHNKAHVDYSKCDQKSAKQKELRGKVEAAIKEAGYEVVKEG